jgi:hypothetical protein
MVGAVGSEHLGPAVVQTGHPYRVLDGLGAAGVVKSTCPSPSGATETISRAASPRTSDA